MKATQQLMQVKMGGFEGGCSIAQSGEKGLDLAKKCWFVCVRYLELFNFAKNNEYWVKNGKNT